MPKQRQRKVGTGKSAAVKTERVRATANTASPSTVVQIGRNTARIVLITIVATAPWYYAAATWDAQLAYNVATLLLLFLASIFSPHRDGNVLHRCLTVLLCLALLQTVALPEIAWSLLSPNATIEENITKVAEEIGPIDEPVILEDDSAQVSNLAVPRTTSVSPHTTQAATVSLSTALAMLWAGTLLLDTVKWRIALLAVLCISGVANAGLGILQSLSTDNWALLPGLDGPFFGSFANRNSAPQFYAIGVGANLALLVWWFKSKSSSVNKKYRVHYPAINGMARFRRLIESLVSELDAVLVILLFTLVISSAAILATASRGGILAFSLACLVLSIRQLSDFRASYLALAMLLGSIAAVLLFSFLGFDNPTSQRLGTLSEEFHQLSNVRLRLWSEVLSHSEYWLTGSGYGTFHLAVLACDLPNSGAWFYHGENLFVEILVTLGLLAFVLVLTSLALFLFELITQTKKKQYLHLAALLAVCAIVTQSMVDFSVILPGIFLPLAALVGGTQQERSSGGFFVVQKTERWLSILILSVAATLGWLPLLNLAQAERLATAQGMKLTSTLEFEIARQEQIAFSNFVRDSATWPASFDEGAMRYFSRPENVLACLRHRRREFSFLAELSQNSDQDIMKFLRSTSIPMANHVQQSPLDWRASWGLLRSDLNVLSSQERTRNLARLYLTSSHKPELLSEIGTYLLLSEQHEVGRRFWQKAVFKSPTLARKAIRLVPEMLNGRELTELLPKSPFLHVETALGLEKRGNPEDAQQIFDAVSLLEISAIASSASDWRYVAILAEHQKDLEAAASAYVKAASMNATNEQYRFDAAEALFKAGKYEQAEAELAIALRKSPNNAKYAALSQKIQAGKDNKR